MEICFREHVIDLSPLHYIVGCSLYYKRNVKSGANRRFDEVFRRIYEIDPSRLLLIVSEGECPTWFADGNFMNVQYTQSLIGRLSAQKQLSHILNQIPPSIIITDFIPIPLAALRRHIHLQLIFDLRFLNKYRRSGFRRFLKRYHAWQIKLSEHILTTSNTSKEEIIRRLNINQECILVSYNGVSDDWLRSYEYSNKKKKYDILYVAAFEKRKNHNNLLKALPMIGSDIKVALVGNDNGYKKSIEKTIDTLRLKRNIDFLPVMSEGDLIELYRKSKVFVYPSNYEGFGIPLLEAMATGMPIACSNIPVFREIAEKRALYFDQTSPENIANTLDTLLRTEKENNIEKMRKFIVSKYSWDVIVCRFINDLRELIGEKSRSGLF